MATSRRTERTETAILDAAEGLLARGGPQALTIDALAAEAGVALGTIYARFGGKDGVQQALAVRLLAINAEYLEEAAARGATPLEALLAVGDAYLRFHRDHPIAFRLIGQRDLGKTVADRQLAMLDRLAGVVRDGIASGHIRDVDPRATATYCWASWNGMLALRAQGRLNESRLRETVKTGRQLLRAALERADV